jgi:hypothetical protein
MKKKKHLTPGEVVHQELGMSRAARIAGITPTAAWRWWQPKPAGTGGLVPAEHQRAIVEGSDGAVTCEDIVMGRRV